MAVTATPGAGQVALIDPGSLFREIGEDRILFRALIETAQHDLPQGLTELQWAAKQGDFSTVRQKAHSMKTTLAHWGARCSLELAQRIESFCREDQPQEAIVLIPAFDQEIRALLVALEKLEEFV